MPIELGRFSIDYRSNVATSNIAASNVAASNVATSGNRSVTGREQALS